MPYMVMARDRTVATLSGHNIEFKKDDMTFVPAAAVAECMARGAVPFEGEDLPQDDEEDAKPKVEALDPDARKAAIFKAFETVIGRDERGDFDAAGKPSPKVLSSLVGFTVEAKERNQMWAAFQETDS